MKITHAVCGALAVFLFTACEKDPAFPGPTDPVYKITVNNEFNPLEARLAVFLSNDDGHVLVFKELPNNAGIQVEVPGSAPDDRFDCTVVKIIVIDAPGSGVRDTIINLTTYTGLPSGETINLRNLIYHKTTDLNVTFTGANSVDSIIVADALTFARPLPENNFTGQYRVLHTGKLWLRVLVNGQQMWRFIRFDDINTPTLTTTVDVNLMLPIFAAPKTINLPFTAAWDYKVDGLVDTAALKFLAMGDLLRAPGGPVPVFGSVDIYEPVSNDIFDPAPKPYNGFRVQAKGSDDSPGGYTYFSDFLYANVPANLPLPAFNLEPTTLSDNRLVATQCFGQFDALVFARARTGTPNISWEVYMAPSNGIVSYRLPDVPTTLGSQFPSLKNYDFGGQVRARAESYEKLDYESAIRQKLLNADPLWQAKAGYLGREEVQ